MSQQKGSCNRYYASGWGCFSGLLLVSAISAFSR